MRCHASRTRSSRTLGSIRRGSFRQNVSLTFPSSPSLLPFSPISQLLRRFLMLTFYSFRYSSFQDPRIFSTNLLTLQQKILEEGRVRGELRASLLSHFLLFFPGLGLTPTISVLMSHQSREATSARNGSRSPLTPPLSPGSSRDPETDLLPAVLE